MRSTIIKSMYAQVHALLFDQTFSYPICKAQIPLKIFLMHTYKYARIQMSLKIFLMDTTHTRTLKPMCLKIFLFLMHSQMLRHGRQNVVYLARLITVCITHTYANIYMHT
jgi:hypothetical protein